MRGRCKKCKQVKEAVHAKDFGMICIDCIKLPPKLTDMHGQEMFGDTTTYSLTDNQCHFCGGEFKKDEKIVKWRGEYPVHEEHKDGYTKASKVG